MRIGISISGGGYRATSFGMGTLSYLNHIQLEDKPLLQHTIALSTVSGGSITGITYAQWTKAGLKFEDYFKWLYEKITKFDLVPDAIDKYITDKNKNSLIEGFSSSYSENYLTHRKFWSIQPSFKNGTYDTHLLYYSINSTDFNTGSPFKFIAQAPNWSDYKKRNGLDDKTAMNQFVVGNGFFRLNKDIEKLPLNVALASSSCFPGGFEPIILRTEEHLEKKIDAHKEIALMDGGIVDNQGLDSIIDFQKKIKLDLVIVVDSASPNITKYSQSTFSSHPKDTKDPNLKIKSEISNVPLVGNIKIHYLSKFFYIFTAVIILAFPFFIESYSKNACIFFTVITTFFILSSVLINRVQNILSEALNDEGIDSNLLTPLSHLTPNAIKQLLYNRINSLQSLIGSVFMKHIRRMNTEKLYDVNKSNEKIIINTLYQNKILEDNERFLKMDNSQRGLFENYSNDIKKEYGEEKDILKIKLNERLGGIPTICQNAFNMKTTLWVSKDEAGKNIVRDVIVTGQISTCVNIINNRYIKDNFPMLFEQAQVDWAKFKKNPYWLFNKLQENINDVHAIFTQEQARQKEHFDNVTSIQNFELEKNQRIKTYLRDYKFYQK